MLVLVVRLVTVKVALPELGVGVTLSEAVTVAAPIAAEEGTVMVQVNFPLLAVVPVPVLQEPVEVTVVDVLAESLNVIVIGALAVLPKPDPVTVTVVPTVPEVGLRVIEPAAEA
jgi:hypothetical protein